jgi:hypothetical protein
VSQDLRDLLPVMPFFPTVPGGTGRAVHQPRAMRATTVTKDRSRGRAAPLGSNLPKSTSSLS